MFRILIIDDSLENRENLVEFLSSEGFCVKDCATGEEGIQLAQSFHPHLIICDFLLPGINGEEVFWRLKGTARFLFYTAMADRDTINRLSLLKEKVLLKPSKIAQLEKVINNILSTIRE
jgi:DNA-binding response OmpR family regulator